MAIPEIIGQGTSPVDGGNAILMHANYLIKSHVLVRNRRCDYLNIQQVDVH